VEFSDAYPFHIIIDEPQDIISNSEIFEALLKIDSPCHWLLTATPNPLGKIMQLSLGYQESLVHKLPASPCCLCLLLAAGAGEIPRSLPPSPPTAHPHAPCHLALAETSVLHSYAMQLAFRLLFGFPPSTFPSMG